MSKGVPESDIKWYYYYMLNVMVKITNVNQPMKCLEFLYERYDIQSSINLFLISHDTLFRAVLPPLASSYLCPNDNNDHKRVHEGNKKIGTPSGVVHDGI